MTIRAPSWCASLLVLAAQLGCSASTATSVVDASHDGDAHDSIIDRLDAPPRDARDAPQLDGDPRLCLEGTLGSFGSECRPDGSCDAGLSCGIDVSVAVRALDGTVIDVPIGEGFCTSRCNPSASHPCACGSCVTTFPFGTGRVSVLDELGRGVCVQTCWPYDTTNGCFGPFGCDAVEDACIPACVSDADCRYGSIPGGTDVRFAERTRKPLAPPVTCSRASGSCVRRNVDGPEVGAPCSDDLDCPRGFVCWASSVGAAGSCALLDDCAVRGCGPEARCVEIDGPVTACVRL